MAPGPNNEEPIGGDHSRGMNQVAQTQLKFDNTEGAKLTNWVKDLTKHFQSLRKEVDMVVSGVNNIGPQGSGKTNGITTTGTRTQSTSATSQITTTLAQSNAGGAAPKTPADAIGGKANMGLLGAYESFNMAMQGIRSMDARIDRGRDYALASDRRGSQFEQLYGQSSMQYMTQVREPLKNLRLGSGGINQLADMQLRTGYNTTSYDYAKSVEGLRALSGFTKTTSDVLQQQNAMLDPAVANRMFRMAGVSPIQMGGGGMTDPVKLQQQLVRTMGLTNSSSLKGALAPGSVTRERFRTLGISEEMTTDVLQYAQKNLTFQERGGKGFFDPTKEADRKRMGIEGRLSTEVEETEAKRTAREEDFQKRQIDNFETMERNTQMMVEGMGRIEDMLSGIVGARASTKGWSNLVGKGMMIGGAAAMATGAVPLGAALMGGGMLVSGDPPDNAKGTTAGAGQSISSGNDGSINVPVGYSGNGPGKPQSLNSLKDSGSFKKLSGTMQTRLLNLFRAGQGRIGLGQGWRDPEQQKQMFLDRHVETTKGNHDRVWNGKYWKLVKGAPAAPPGSSMHEIGMAADLVGDMEWLQSNAGKFGLKTFAGVNNEPWHVQPAELPNSRREFEGGNYDVADTQAAGTPKSTTGADSDPSGHGGAGPLGFGGLAGAGGELGMSMSDLIHNQSTGRGWSGWSGGGMSGNTGSADMPAGTPGPTVALNGSGAEIAAQAAFAAGFRGEDLWKIVSIAGRESGFNPKSINKSSNDTGMWQIAPMNFGEYSQQQLLDPMNNAKVAFQLYQSSGFHGWKAANSRKKNSKGQWVVDTSGKGGAGWAMDGNELWHTESHQQTARDAISALNLTGDPYGAGDRSPANMVGSGGATVRLSQPIQISVSPQINFHGSPQTHDLQKIASEVTRMITAEVETLQMRGA